MSEPALSQTISTSALLAAIRSKFFPLLRFMASWLTWIYAGVLALVLMWMEWNAERFWFTGVLLFAPPQVLLLPLLLLTPLCLLLRARLVFVHAALVVIFGWGYMGFRPASQPPQREDEIRLVTHNAGQGNRPQFYGFVKAEKPDLIALQDARGRGQELAKIYPGQHVAGRGEFYLVSKFPIIRSDPVEQAKWYGRTVAMRFEVLCREKPLVIFSVHLPTPRNQLNRFLSGRAFADMLADDDSQRRPSSYGEWTRARIKLANDLAGALSSETLPFLVCGDFNTPDHGAIYHAVARPLADAHAKAGQGWGFTFPGSTRNPLTLREPWLRIDYAFAGRGWKPIGCITEPGRRSQHCAVLARFVPQP